MSEPLLTRDAILAVLSRHIGEERGIPIARLVRIATGGLSTPALERTARRLIEELRRDGQHICAHPTSGYFIADTEAELVRTCQYLYSRAMCSLEQVAAMRRVSLPDLRGQLRLPD